MPGHWRFDGWVALSNGRVPDAVGSGRWVGMINLLRILLSPVSSLSLLYRVPYLLTRGIASVIHHIIPVEILAMNNQLPLAVFVRFNDVM